LKIKLKAMKVNLKGKGLVPLVVLWLVPVLLPINILVPLPLWLLAPM
jgi:hypothetical protein